MRYAETDFEPGSTSSVMDFRKGIQSWDGVHVMPDRLSSLPRRPTNIPTESVVHDFQTVRQRYYRQRTRRVNNKSRHARRLPRLLYKDGAYTLIPKNVPNWMSRFLTDFWNTLLDMSWSAVLLLFLIGYLTVWFLFAGIFYGISYANGDFNVHSNSTKSRPMCVVLGDDRGPSLSGMFLFSVETLRTIGYGSRYPTEHCGGTIFFLCAGCMVSVLLESVLVGLLLAKTHVPQKRSQTLIFSKFATICTRDNQLVLLFRLANIRTSLMLQIVLKAYLVYAKKTDEGEEMPFHQHEINLQVDQNGDQVFLGWPATVKHVIDSSSPFYYLSKKNLSRAAFELIVILEGIVESTGASVQARTSYVPNEILWGKRFDNMYIYDEHTPDEVFDFRYFETTTLQAKMGDLSAFDRDQKAELLTGSTGLGTILNSSSEDLVDGPGCKDAEPLLSPSLADALDIPYDLMQAKANFARAASHRRDSIRSTRLRSRSSMLQAIMEVSNPSSAALLYRPSLKERRNRNSASCSVGGENVKPAVTLRRNETVGGALEHYRRYDVGKTPNESLDSVLSQPFSIL
ncbi:hypothetical protein RvY_07137 [Ramazzottius varieornatus]|uniref:Inward rectifier potassium channel C-terminal domain-containing protein n=1 Tax=Ramazzottius varieornatus TaxID=947166 RepID=A0A1D1V120_RAMVA|nr:hypothetical protein RvY_07137 [Ramazzottius varieornatus]